MDNFKRGFKASCETMAVQFRTALGLEPVAPLPAAKLAAHIGVRVLNLCQIPALDENTIQQLTINDPESWSALLLHHRNKKIAVVNPCHSDGRKESSLMHECSHVILKHKPMQILNSNIGMMVSSFDKDQENEADWLAGALLLPRVALLKIAYIGVDYDVHTKMYGVSAEMLRMRLDRTGVNLQLKRRAS